MYYAHISEDKLRSQTVLNHLEGTAALAGEFASAFGCGEWGYGVGLLHDIGKYSDSFQRRLKGGPRTDHSTAGAVELEYAKNRIAAYCVAGHHAGLPNGGVVGDVGGESTLLGRLHKKPDTYQIYKQEIKFPSFPPPGLRPLGKGGFSMSFFIRMLFSCLVDADFLDTEAFMMDHAVKRGGSDSMDVLLRRLQAHISPWLKNTDMTTVNGRRTAILKACLAAGKQTQGLYTLTVPTGGGKTVSSLAFALNHVLDHHLERIIYVIPYTSIIEQNARVFQDILGKDNVLEDHSNVTFESGEELKKCQLAAENWDRPVVVTTNVQFFESLFSNKVSKCRKLHHISKSVVIFDEAQMLPVPYLKPCIRAISELVYNYGSTAVICTATQPALKKLFPGQIKGKEICQDVREQYAFFARTKIEKQGKLTEKELCIKLQEQQQALCILNSRKRVQRVYETLRGEGNYHLSTLMYPEHRTRMLGEIRTRLKEGRTCRLVATSLVEAGVDFDFATVYRELAGIDSVIQAAGRCNREGKRSREESRTVIFTLEEVEDIHLPRQLKLPASVAEQIADCYDDIASPEAVEEYFDRLYRFKGEEGLDAREIVDKLEGGARTQLYPFKEVSDQFHLIESNTRTILIDQEPEAASIVERIKRGEYTRELVRAAGHYSVSVYEKDFEALNGAGRLEQIAEEYYLLRNREQYTEEEGLVIDVSRGEGVFY